MDNRERVFISHAGFDDDNEFTKWLALKLIALGYEVWCDVLELDKGEDFWKRIEDEIRNNAVKFLLVSTNLSNQREGVLKEIAVASKVKVQLNDNKFIIPLMLDAELSTSDVNIETIRLNGINFKDSWASGLQDLIDALEKQNVPKNEPNANRSRELYEQIFLVDKMPIEKEEIHQSNWFEVLEFPTHLKFHNFAWRVPEKFKISSLPFPAVRYKTFVCSFADSSEFLPYCPDLMDYSEKNSIDIPVTDLLSSEFESEVIDNSSCNRILVQIMNTALERFFETSKTTEYEMSNKKSYWYQKGVLEKDKYNKVKLVGKQKLSQWHFAVSGFSKLYPFPVVVFNSHIVFTTDGKELIELKSSQHSKRRSQGKGWWNNHWKTKLLGFVESLGTGSDCLEMPVSESRHLKVNIKPVQFLSEMSYAIPNAEILKEEEELEEMTNRNEDTEDENN